MTCEEYREKYQFLLDRRSGEAVPTELASHASACQSCTAFTASLLQIDRGLQRIPPVPLADSLRETLLGIREPAPDFAAAPGWWPEIRTGILFLVPGIALAAGGTVAQPAIRVLLQAVVLSAGICAFAVSVLKRRILGLAH